MGAAICMKLSCLPHMHVCVCACMCAVHVHMCGGTPNHPPPLSYHLPPPRAAGSLKHQNSITLGTNRDNSILFEDSLLLNIPELIYTKADHPRTPPHLPHPPEPRKPKSEELQ